MVAIQDQLLAAVGDRRGVGAADRLCEACVVLFGVDAATFRWFSMGATAARWGPAGCRHGCMTSCSSSWVGAVPGLGGLPRAGAGDRSGRSRCCSVAGV